MTDAQIDPHGGDLVSLDPGPERREELKALVGDAPAVTLGERDLADLELLITGAYSPLTGYLGKDDHESVCERLRLRDGTLWPLPLTLAVSAETAEQLEAGGTLALRDPEGVPLAAVHVEEVWRPDLRNEARLVFGSEDSSRSEVADLLAREGCRYVGGRVEGISLPAHYDFRRFRFTPRELRTDFARVGWRRVAGYHSERSLHRAEVAQITLAARDAGSNLLVHPVVGVPQPGDLDHFARLRAVVGAMNHVPEYTTRLALLTYLPRGAGAREALALALIRKNYGLTHLMLDPSSTPVRTAAGGWEEIEALFAEHGEECGVALVPLPRVVFSEDLGEYVREEELPAGARSPKMTEEEVRSRLIDGREVPGWFSFPEVVEALGRTHPPRSRQGFTIFLTGLSGAGKSTIAKVIMARLLELGGRAVSLLDGDIVRRHLSSELGFSREHRDINIRRIGFVASEISKNGGVAICAPIAPYDRTRREVREIVTKSGGGFVLAHVSTPLAICEERDRKGLYAKARAGVIKEFTGVSDPYEEPEDAEVRLDTSHLTAEQAAQEVMLYLRRAGYLSASQRI
jgi:sulfate adenylyltransferase